MKKIVSYEFFALGCLLASLIPHSAFANDSALTGTHSVVFRPVVSKGKQHGCTLTYQATQTSHLFIKNGLVTATGYISAHINAQNIPVLMLKIGLRDYTSNKPLPPPNFAYIKSETKTTAKNRSTTSIGERNELLVSTELNEESLNLIIEMLAFHKVTIGYSQKDNLDELIPLDLDVYNTELLSKGSIIRKRSANTALNFLNCYQTVFGHLIPEQKMNLGFPP